MGLSGESPNPCNGSSHLPPPPPSGCVPRSFPLSFTYPRTTRWDGWAVSAAPLERAGEGDELGLPPKLPRPRSPSSLSTGRGGGGGGHDADPGPPRIHCPGSSVAPLSSATRISSSKSNGGKAVATASPGRQLPLPSEGKYSASIVSCNGFKNRSGLEKYQ